MGSVVRVRDAARPARDTSGLTPVLEQRPRGVTGAMTFVAYPGEIVGLAGLGGHGQTQTLVSLFMGQGGDWLSPRDSKVAFVAGDRHVDGNLPLWSILRNITITLLPDLPRFGPARGREEGAVGRNRPDGSAIRPDARTK